MVFPPTMRMLTLLLFCLATSQGRPSVFAAAATDTRAPADLGAALWRAPSWEEIAAAEAKDKSEGKQP
jgi:hypothetical protein